MSRSGLTASWRRRWPHMMSKLSRAASTGCQALFHKLVCRPSAEDLPSSLRPVLLGSRLLQAILCRHYRDLYRPQPVTGSGAIPRLHAWTPRPLKESDFSTFSGVRGRHVRSVCPTRERRTATDNGILPQDSAPVRTATLIGRDARARADCIRRPATADIPPRHSTPDIAPDDYLAQRRRQLVDRGTDQLLHFAREYALLGCPAPTRRPQAGVYRRDWSTSCQSGPTRRRLAFYGISDCEPIRVTPHGRTGQDSNSPVPREPSATA